MKEPDRKGLAEYQSVPKVVVERVRELANEIRHEHGGEFHNHRASNGHSHRGVGGGQPWFAEDDEV